MVPIQKAINPTLIPFAAADIEGKPPVNTIKNVKIIDAMPNGINPDKEHARNAMNIIRQRVPS